MFNEPHNKFIKAIEHAAARWWRSILLTPVLLVQPSVRPSWTLMRIKYQVPPAHLFRNWKWWRGKWNWSINRHFYYQPVHDRRRRLFAELNVTPEQSTCRASSSLLSPLPDTLSFEIPRCVLVALHLAITLFPFSGQSISLLLRSRNSICAAIDFIFLIKCRRSINLLIPTKKQPCPAHLSVCLASLILCRSISALVVRWMAAVNKNHVGLSLSSSPIAWPLFFSPLSLIYKRFVDDFFCRIRDKLKPRYVQRARIDNSRYL